MEIDRLYPCVVDLHVHTVLSPCASVEMIPPLLVHRALAVGIQVIAITDHNASANVAAVQQAAAGSGLTVLPGMELQTREEVHLLSLFDTLEQLAELQACVDAGLPEMMNNPEFFGEQFVVDGGGRFLRREPRLLATSVDMSLDDAVGQVRELGGLAIPAHVDRSAFSLLANLGLVPAGLAVDALEISRHLAPAEACTRYPQLAGFPLIQNSDAHALDELLGSTRLMLARPAVAELRLAFAAQAGRTVTIHTHST